VNAVCFGNFQVSAKVARFDRSADKVVVRDSVGEGVEVKGLCKKDVGEGGIKMSSAEGVRVELGLSADAVIAEGTIGEGEVTVGKVRVRLNKGVDKAYGVSGGGAGVGRKSGGVEKKVQVYQESRSQVERQPSIQKLLRVYRSRGEDLQWARSGFLATVTHGEAIRVIQNRIEDVGFNALDVTPLGADRVFIHSSSGMDVSSILEGAKEFFSLFLTNLRRWDKEVLPFQRGAWLRMYGVPLHAWNEAFFKLCVFNCGRFLRTDCCSVDKDRFDYARVLIATSSLDVVDCVENIVVDGEIVEIKIVEEWGFNIGDDACLYEPEEETQSCRSDHDGRVGDGDDFCEDVDLLVDNIVKELAKDDKEKSQEAEEAGTILVDKEVGSVEQQHCVYDDEGSPKVLTSELAAEQTAVGSDNCTTDLSFSREDFFPIGEARVCGEETKVTALSDNVQLSLKNNGCCLRTTSCPQRAAHSLESGPWSLEWISDQHHGAAGVISSSRRQVKKMVRPRNSSSHSGTVDKKRKKVDGVLRHTVYSLKKVARLPSKDRLKVLQILKKKARKRQGSARLKKAVNVVSQSNSNCSSSSGSVNNDWSHWVVMHGDEKVAVEDVWGIGKAIGVQFNGDTHNMFGLLARDGKGRGKMRSQEVVEGGCSSGRGR